jgi:dUTP pyrophosphatase
MELNELFNLLHENAEVPQKSTDFSSGYDIKACFPDVNQTATILPQNWLLVKTGFSLNMMKFNQLEENSEGALQIEAQVRSRSGLALKNGIAVLNGIGTIDKDYEGEVGVILYNHSSVPFIFKHGDRIAQLVFASVINPVLQPKESLQIRGEGGFGSTGI